MIRVLIKASSPVIRAGLESLLRAYPQFQITDELREAAPSSDGFPEDTVTDIILGAADDAESAPEALERVANGGSVWGTSVILLVNGPAAELAEALRQGVRALLPNNASGPQIAAALEAVAVGLSVFDAAQFNVDGVEQSLLPGREPPAPLPEALTPREIEILRALSDGLANKEIAGRFGISENTVKFHVASVMGKLGAASRTEAVTIGIRHGIVLI